MPGFFFYGKEDFDIDFEVEQIKKQNLDTKFASINQKIINNPDFATLQSALLTASLMNIKSVVIINCENLFKDSSSEKFSFSDKQIKEIENSLKQIPQSLFVVFVCKIEREFSKKIDKRKKLFKIFSNNLVSKEFNEYRNYDFQLVKRVESLAKNFNMKFEKNAIEFLIRHSGVNLRVLNSEIEKISLIIYPESLIKIEHIKRFLNSNEEIFNLIDYILKKDVDKMFNLIDSSLAKRHPLELVATLQNSLSSLIYIKKYSKTMQPSEISQKIGLHEYVVKLNIGKIKNISLDNLVNLKLNLVEAENEIKKGTIEGRLAFEKACLKT